MTALKIRYNIGDTEVCIMECPKCKSSNVTVSENVFTKSVHRSLIWNLFMIFLTGGIWLVWMLVRKRKEKTVHVKMAVCQSCGNSWKLK